MSNQNPNFDRSLSFLIGDISRLFTTELQRRMKEHELNFSPAQFRVVGELFRSDGISQTELAEVLCTEKAPLGTLIDKLEAANMIERRPDPNDRRVNRVYLTSCARGILPKIREIAYELYGELLNGLDEQQVETLIDTLVLLRSNIEASREH